MHDKQKIPVDVKFTQMTANKRINRHCEQVIEAIYKEYIRLDRMQYSLGNNIFVWID